MSSDPVPRYPAVRPGGDENDDDGDGGEDDDNDNNDDDDSGSGKRKGERRGASRQTSLLAMRAEKRKWFPKIIPPRKRATGITRKREPRNQEDVSKKALPIQAEGIQQYTPRPNILNIIQGSRLRKWPEIDLREMNMRMMRNSEERYQVLE
ncbi:uncharacterized protein Bfra_008366 [Botrytis fragariae]|uniref:Uncharacterized protein n=1 Tax=Botrytis fragariae TaxID=1964551 RepID=A0A8H6EI35_9HELO|nr:uncharacterized protein Bfra_008366 [Botrytis fragariae]KAF5873089.1 hypothetical protein Bfra_008366 [Botrytis fragariae]